MQSASEEKKLNKGRVVSHNLDTWGKQMRRN